MEITRRDEVVATWELRSQTRAIAQSLEHLTWTRSPRWYESNRKNFINYDLPKRQEPLEIQPVHPKCCWWKKCVTSQQHSFQVTASPDAHALFACMDRECLSVRVYCVNLEHLTLLNKREQCLLNCTGWPLLENVYETNGRCCKIYKHKVGWWDVLNVYHTNV